MDLNLGGVVRQVVTPVLDTARQAVTTVGDTVTMVRTGTIDQIASFIRANPEQRGTVETALATNGRTGDLSSIIERVGTTVTTTVAAATSSAAQAVSQTAETVNQVAGMVGRTVDAAAVVTRPVGSAADQLLGRATTAIAEPLRTASDLVGRTAASGASVAGQVVGSAGEAAALAGRFAAPSATVAGRVIGSAAEAATQPTVNNGRQGAEGIATQSTRGGDALAVALREGRLMELIATAMKEGRFGELLIDARAAGRLPDLALATRSLDGVLAAFAAKGGLSVTELALLARSGLLSEADLRTLRSAGLPLGMEAEDAAALFAPRDGPGEARFGSEVSDLDGNPLAGALDPALACFDAGAIRIASRAAFESYGLLGPPGSTVVAADAFEGLVRDADGDLRFVEQRLGFEAGALTDPDTFVALIDRRDLFELRLAGERGAMADWLPGGDRAGGLPSALIDPGRATVFREVTIGGGVA